MQAHARQPAPAASMCPRSHPHPLRSQLPAVLTRSSAAYMCARPHPQFMLTGVHQQHTCACSHPHKPAAAPCPPPPTTTHTAAWLFFALPRAFARGAAQQCWSFGSGTLRARRGAGGRRAARSADPWVTHAGGNSTLFGQRPAPAPAQPALSGRGRGSSCIAACAS